MRKRKKLEFRYIVMIILVVVIAFLTIFSYTLKDNRKLNPIEVVIKDSIVTLQKIVYAPIDFIGNIFAKNSQANPSEITESLNQLKAENSELKNQINALKEELNIDYVLTDYEYLNATVVSRNIGHWYNTITIDKGTYNGISEDMAVVNSEGLIGKIINTTNFTSTVKLLSTTDSNSKVSVSIYSGELKLNGLIHSYDYQTDLLVVEGISNSEVVNIGDTVATSGLGGIFPSGILIGYVEDITTDEYDLAKILKVRPNVDYDDINYVTVLKRKDKE
ncbi:MAG: rod shape-determining protein MreC [bacterium]|nr:rod shape-determining protein MreC [bacterium]